MTAAALVVAAGRGTRLGSDGPKAFVVVGGRPMLAWSLAVLDASPAISSIVVAEPDGALARDVLPSGRVPLTGVPGGAERSHSVRNGLAAVPADTALVVVHDAARPLVTAQIVADCVAAMADPSVDAAVAAAPVTDTVKEVAAEPADPDRPLVTATLDRSRLWAVQTPQVFRRDVLERVLAQRDSVLAAATDDASLVEATGGRVVLVRSSRANMKITTAEDLRLAELLLAERARES